MAHRVLRQLGLGVAKRQNTEWCRDGALAGETHQSHLDISLTVRVHHSAASHERMY